MKKDMLISFINHVFVLGCGLLLFRYAASSFGPSGFGEYALARRAVSFLQPVLLMGLGVGLVRYVAISGPDAGARAASYALSGCIAVAVFSVVALGVVCLFPDFFGRVIFGKDGYAQMVSTVALTAGACVVNALAFAYHRGRGAFASANALMTVGQGVVPLAAVLVSKDVVGALRLTAWATGIFSAAFLLPALWRAVSRRKELQLMPATRELLRYGLARMPGDLSLAGMMALPAFLTAGFYGIREAGYVAFGISMVSMVGAVFGPVGFVTLPRLTAILSEGRHDEARRILRKVIGWTLLVSFGTTALVFAFTGWLVRNWLGESFMPSVDIIRLAMLGAVPHALYVSLRSSIDAAYVKAVNSLNIFKALAASMLAYSFVKAGDLDVLGIPLSFVLGMTVLCLLTVRVSLSAYGLGFGLVRVRT